MIWRALHTLALFWMMAGIGSVVIPIWRSWRTQGAAASVVTTKVMLLTEAERHQSLVLLPAMIAVGLTGYGWSAASGVHVITTGWLLAVEILFALDLFVFLPLMGVGLRRVRLLSLVAQKRGAPTEELRDAEADNVALVFGTLLTATLPPMALLAVFKPF